MKVLGIDPGFSKIGWAIVAEGQLLTYGHREGKTPYKTLNAQTIAKMRYLYPQFRDLVVDSGITHLIVERVPVLNMAHRDKVIATMNMFRVLAIEMRLYYAEEAPVKIKRLATGSSRATKDEMKQRCLDLFELADVPGTPADVYDAIMAAYVGYSTPTLDWWTPLDPEVVE